MHLAHLVGLLSLSVVLFGSTNIDDIFVLLGFFADPRFRTRQIVVGQYLGIGALYGASVAASLLSLVVPSAYIGLLGLAPIGIGLKRLRDRRAGAMNEEAPAGQAVAPAAWGQAMTVAAVTVANGGDNISIYTPLFATRSGRDVAVVGAVFAVLTAVWLVFAHWLTHHPTLGAPIRRYGHRLVPFVLIALGVLILHDAGTIALLRR